MLELRNVSIRYGAIAAVSDVSLKVAPGGIVTLIGANGAGKTTTLKAISGLLKARGDILYNGRNVANLAPDRLVGEGLCHVPEGRMVFGGLTVAENLQMGAYRVKDRAAIRQTRDFVFGMFPRLAERQNQAARTLSGGEQQMLAIGRALMSRPKLLMLDEPSLGIAPMLVKTIFEKIVEINKTQGITILLVEQNANLALEISQSGYVLESGRVILSGASEALRKNERVREAYLGGR